MQMNLNKLPLAFFTGVLILFFVAGAFAKEDPNAPARSIFAKPNVAKVINKSLSNIGNWSYPIWATGTSGNSFNGVDPGGIYPRSTAAAIFTDGLVWGGYIEGDDQPRVGGVTYREGVQQGWIVTPGDGVNEPVFSDPDDPRAVMWRIRGDYKTLSLEDVRKDAAEMNLVDPENATTQMMQDVLDQYANDWVNWPVELGAPYYDVNKNGQYDAGYEEDLNGDGIISIGEREEPGIAKADQVLWCTYNDKQSKTLYGADSIGIELHATTWAYNQPSATLGQLIFRKYTFFNKSGFDLDSMFVCQWSDPDVGTYTDDFVGCDTTRSLGYAYTSSLTDGDYSAFNLPPAAMGYDFFQGPMVPSTGDTAIFNLEKVADHKNLPMTSFFYFASGSNITDPPLGDYDGTLEFYNMLNGYTPTTSLDNPTPYTVGSGPLRGEPTKFPLDGNVVTQQGDVDGQGSNLQPGDRRMGLCSGPFKMANGETQEVVVAIIGGIVPQAGGNNRNAVVQLQLNSDFAQFIYNNLFQAIPRAPEKPEVAITPMEDHIVLEWGSNAAKVATTEADDPLLGFNFEGYNIYQLPSASSTIEQATRIATYDVINGITSIYGTKFVGSIGDIVTIPIQNGTDTGIKRSFVVEKDYLTGGVLYAGATYYFAVTAYNYNSDPTVPEPSLESSAEALIVTVQGTVPGTRFPAESGDLLSVTKTGGSTGDAEVEVVNPAKLRDANYSVGFHTTPQYSVTDGDTLGTWYEWYLVNTSSGDTLVKNQRNLAGDNDYLTTEGVLVRVSGPKTAGLAGWGSAGTRWYTGVNTFGNDMFFGGLGLGADFFGSDVPLADLVPVHMVFQDQASVDANGYATKGVVYRRDKGYAEEGIGELPFECFDVKDAANPRKLNVSFVEDDREGATGANANLIWDMGWNGAEFGANGAREYIFISLTTYDEGAYYANNANDGTYNDVAYAIWPAGRGTHPNLEAIFTMDIFANLPNTPDDSYTFSTEGVVSDDEALAKVDVEKVNVFPNPYYGANPAEPDRFTRFVTFNHMPKTATIRIFNLAGIQVRKIEKDSPDQFLKWDLQNENRIPVASGMYIAHIDMGTLGQKVLKIMVIQAQEVLKYY